MRRPPAADFPSPLSRLFPRLVHADFTPPVYFQRRPSPRNRLLRLLRGLFVWNYELTVVERVVELPWAIQNLGVPPGAAVLDFGCSQSPLALHLASLGYRVTGVDLRPYGFTHPNLTFVPGDFLEAGFAAGGFDAVVAVSAVEHTGLGAYGDPHSGRADRLIVAEFARVLRPGGRLLVTVPCGRRGETSWYRVYDREGLADLLSGFAIERIDYYAGVGRRAWMPVSADAIARIDSAGSGHAQGVACVVALNAPPSPGGAPTRRPPHGAEGPAP